MQTKVNNDALSKQLIHGGVNEKFRKILVDEIRAETHAVSSKEVSDAHKTLSLFWKLNPVRGKDLSTRLLIHMVNLLKDIEIKPKIVTPSVVTKIPANGLHASSDPKQTKLVGDDQKTKRTVDLAMETDRVPDIDPKPDNNKSKRKKKDA
jgi:hypothetical protein